MSRRVGIRHEPRQSDLRGSGLFAFRPCFQERNELQIVRQIVGREARLRASNIALGEAGALIDGAGQETDTERAPRDETDAQLLAERNHFALRTAPQHRVFVLHGRYGERRMGTAQGVQAHFGQPPVEDLAFLHQILDRTRDILDRHIGVHPMLIEKIDAVRAETAQHAFDDALYASIRLLNVLAAGDENLADIRKRLPVVTNTPEMRFDCDDVRKFAVIDEVRARLADRGDDVVDIDGVRVSVAGGWWLLRASNTQPVLVARCEAPDETALDLVKQDLLSAVSPSGIVPPGF